VVSWQEGDSERGGAEGRQPKKSRRNGKNKEAASHDKNEKKQNTKRERENEDEDAPLTRPPASTPASARVPKSMPTTKGVSMTRQPGGIISASDEAVEISTQRE